MVEFDIHHREFQFLGPVQQEESNINLSFFGKFFQIRRNPMIPLNFRLASEPFIDDPNLDGSQVSDTLRHSGISA